MKTQNLSCIALVLFLLACSGERQELAPSGQVTGPSNTLMLTDSQIRLANVTLQKAAQKPIGQTVVINARVAADQDLTEVISSRVGGRLEKLYVKETGRPVSKGEPLYEVYSEILLTLAREYLLARQQYEQLGASEPRYESFLKSAEKKLLLYGLSESQIENIALSKAAQQRVTFLAPVSGVVSEIAVAEGQYVQEGTQLYKIDNFTKVWVEAELYPGETEFIRYGDRVKVEVAGFENSPAQATVNYLSPEFESNTQITLLRAVLDNPDLKFKPGTQAQVFFSHSAKKAITLPVDAIIRNGKGAHVYIQSGTNTFEPRMVKTGIEDVEQVEITDGVKEGEIVAVTGAYLLYSELVLRKGSDPMAGHSHH